MRRAFSSMLLLFGLGSAGLSACYDDITTEDLCRPAFSGCDFDGDGVYNQADEFPADAACQVASSTCVCTQSDEFCDYDGDGILNGMTRNESTQSSSYDGSTDENYENDGSTTECRQYGEACGYYGSADDIYVSCCSGSICIDQSIYSQCMYSCEGDCPVGFTCQLMGSTFACAEIGEGSGETTEEEEPESGTEDCQPVGSKCEDGWGECCDADVCYWYQMSSYGECLRSCDEGCPEGMICRGVSSAAGVGYACVNDGCGNEECDYMEYYNGYCAQDCGSCGDGICQDLDWEFCSQDCEESEEENWWDEGGEGDDGDGESGATTSSAICYVSQECVYDACFEYFEACLDDSDCTEQFICSVECMNGVPTNSCTFSGELIVWLFDCIYDYCTET